MSSGHPPNSSLLTNYRARLGRGLSDAGGDVGAVVAPVDADLRDRLVGPGPSVRDVGAHGGDREDTPTRGHQRAVLTVGGPGVDHVDPFDALGVHQPVDHVTGARGGRVVL